MEDTDVVIVTIGDTMVFRMKEYPGDTHGYPWAECGTESGIPLEHGTAFVWRTRRRKDQKGIQKRELSDDWKTKHGVYWPKPGDACYRGPSTGKRRLAVVFRCTKPSRYYAVRPPHRVALPVA